MFNILCLLNLLLQRILGYGILLRFHLNFPHEKVLNSLLSYAFLVCRRLYRRKAEGRGQKAEGKKAIFDTIVSPLWSAIRSKARLWTLWVLEVINSWKICGAKENIG
jgi:hypothetical protein